MNRIRLLEKNLINKIAAGEVVERPASVVKELVENSIDAGSRIIEVEISDGGMDFIRVTDDGAGIYPEDLVLAFSRHATSKIKCESDLWSLYSMGFRGEALSSIGAVSRVVMSSGRDDVGASIHVEGGEVISQGPTAFSRGTTISVSDIFFNTPARKEFLKSAVTEGNQVYDTVVRLALSHPEVSISFSNHRRQVFMTDGNGKLKDVILAIFGADYARRMIQIDYQHGSTKIFGMLGNLELTRKNRKGQMFFVNRRVVRNSILSVALEEAYHGLLLNRERPTAVLFLELPPEKIDVNVHPQKTEIRFHDERSIFTAVKSGVRDTLFRAVNPNFSERYLERVDLERETERRSLASGAYQNTLIDNNGIAERMTFLDYSNPPQDSQQSLKIENMFPQGNSLVKNNDRDSLLIRLLGQWQDSYLVCEIDKRLYIIDQHAAHERLMFNKIKSLPQQVLKQELAVPVAFEMPTDLISVAEENHEMLKELGFELDRFGDKSMVLRTVPAVTAGEEIETLIEILDNMRSGKSDEEARSQGIMKVLACKSSIKAGQRLDYIEMTRLLEDWWRAESREFCPHGRPTCVILDRSQMDRLMKR